MFNINILNALFTIDLHPLREKVDATLERGFQCLYREAFSVSIERQAVSLVRREQCLYRDMGNVSIETLTPSLVSPRHRIFSEIVHTFKFSLNVGIKRVACCKICNFFIFSKSLFFGCRVW